jgi:hypothetical protein
MSVIQKKQSKETLMSKKFNPLNSKGLRGKSPSARYPNSKGIQAIFSEGQKVDEKPAVCEHEKVSYKNLFQITKRAYEIIDRLSYCVVMYEQKLDKQKKLIEKLGVKNDL